MRERGTGIVLNHTIVPVADRRNLSIRVRNFETNRLKVNDADGNPVEIAAIVGSISVIRVANIRLVKVAVSPFEMSEAITTSSKDAMKAKKLREALQQMAEEGVVQLFLPHDGAPAIVGVVGALQLDVLKERLMAEYGLPVSFEMSRFSVCRWVSADQAADLDKFITVKRGDIARDLEKSPGASVVVRKRQFELSPYPFPRVRNDSMMRNVVGNQIGPRQFELPPFILLSDSAGS